MRACGSYVYSLGVVRGLGDDSDLVSGQVDGVETDTELSDKGEISGSLGGSLNELGGSGLGDNTEVSLELIASHTHTGIADGQSLGLLVDGNADLELLNLAQRSLVGECQILDLVQCISAVGNQLTEEDLTLGVQGVDENVHQTVHLSLELEGFLLGLKGGLLLGSETRRAKTTHTVAVNNAAREPNCKSRFEMRLRAVERGERCDSSQIGAKES
jgi:hypothetical protein